MFVAPCACWSCVVCVWALWTGSRPAELRAQGLAPAVAAGSCVAVAVAVGEGRREPPGDAGLSGSQVDRLLPSLTAEVGRGW